MIAQNDVGPGRRADYGPGRGRNDIAARPTKNKHTAKAGGDDIGPFVGANHGGRT